MGEPAVKRRKKNEGAPSSRPQVPKSINQLRGRSALMATCNGREDRRATNELVDIVENYIERLYPSDDDDDDDDGVKGNEKLSMKDRLARQVAAFRESRNRVKAYDLQTQGLVYIAIEDKSIDVVRIARSIATGIDGLPKSRRLIRLMPLTTVCFASLEEVKEAAKPLVDAAFGDEKEVLKYAVALKRRNNTTFPRKEVVEMLAGLVPEKHAVDLDNPDVTILCEVFKSIAGISVIRDYAKHKEFNLKRIREAFALDEDEERGSSLD